MMSMGVSGVIESDMVTARPITAARARAVRDAGVDRSTYRSNAAKVRRELQELLGEMARRSGEKPPWREEYARQFRGKARQGRITTETGRTETRITIYTRAT